MNSWQQRDVYAKSLERKYLQRREAEVQRIMDRINRSSLQEHDEFFQNSQKETRVDAAPVPASSSDNHVTIDEAFAIYTPDCYDENGVTLRMEVPSHTLGPALSRPLPSSYFATSSAEDELDSEIEMKKHKAIREQEECNNDYMKNLINSNILLFRADEPKSLSDIRHRQKLIKWKYQNTTQYGSKSNPIRLGTYYPILSIDEYVVTPSIFCGHNFSLTGIDKNIACVIMSYLDIRTILRLSQVNKWWHKLCFDENVMYWKTKWNDLIQLFDFSFKLLREKSPPPAHNVYAHPVPADQEAQIETFKDTVLAPLLAEPDNCSLIRSHLIGVYKTIQEDYYEPKQTNKGLQYY